MYNLYMYIPFLSIGIFFAVFIVSVLFAWRNGWRAALFVAITTLILSTIFAMIIFFTVKTFWWSIYKDWFIKKNLPPYHNNSNLLMDLYKPRVVAFFSLFALPIVYGITIGLWFLFRDKINAYLTPKNRKINEHEREVYSYAKSTRSRIIGVSILGTTSLFSASAVASSMGSYFSPYANANFMNRFTDTMSGIYTFGMSRNVEDSSVVDDLMPYMKDDLYDGFNAILTWEASANGESVPTTSINNFADTFETYGPLLGIMDSYPDATYNLINLIIRCKPKLYESSFIK